jgi:hypothetical protein
MAKRPYFIWDYDISEEQVWEILQGDNETRKVWLISRILQYARWDDIWKYLTLDDVHEYFDRIHWRFPFIKDLWAHALEVWGRDDGSRSVRESPALYGPEREPQLVEGILTPLQQDFLARFFANPVGKWFWLTGGMAVAAFYLGHRTSEDLDLFTVDHSALDHARREMAGIAEALRCTLASALSTPTFQQFLLTLQELPPLKLDLVQDVGPQFGERLVVDGIIVDSLENIAANKVTAIFGRTDAKDFVDLYFILQAGYDLKYLIAQAKQKDLGLTEFYLGHMMRQVSRLDSAPELFKPLSLQTLQEFYLGLADELLREACPPT